MARGMKRTLIPIAYRDLETWPRPDICAFDAAIQGIYHGRRRAVEMYAAGDSYLSIHQTTGKGADEVQRLVKRCVTLNDDGRIFGFFSLIPCARIKTYARKSKVVHQKGDGSSGCAGALAQVLERYSEVRQLVHDLFLKQGGRTQVHEARVSLSTIHEEFKKALRQLGFTDQDWPFNTKNCGYQALCSYCKQLEEDRVGRSVLARSGLEATRRGAVGTGFRPLIPNLRAYSFMQLDFHKVDAASIIILKNDHGAELEVPISRWHIGFLVEEKYGAICGAYVALELTPSGDSTLEIIESSFRPTKFAPEDPRSEFTQDGKALVIQLVPELAYQCFSALKVDNGWANAAHEVVNNIMDTVGCTINFGPCFGWWRRQLIE